MGMTAGQDPTDEEAGFRALVEGLLETNLLRCPERSMLIRREAAALVATDAGVAVTIRMLPGTAHAPGSVVVHDGEDPGPRSRSMPGAWRCSSWLARRCDSACRTC